MSGISGTDRETIARQLVRDGAAHSIEQAREMVMLPHALRYALHDAFHVFPCNRRKEPMIENGFLKATIDPDQIRKWWTRWPDANIGIALGASRLVVVDIDGELGLEAMQVLSALDLPATRQVTTGRDDGGLHLYYHAPEGCDLTTSYPADRLEVRAGGSYVIAPPSVHETGRAYVANDADIQRLDHGAINRIKAAQPKGLAPAIGETINAGGRNKMLASGAGTMRRRGFDEGAILAALRHTNETRCKPPLPDDEVAAIAKSIAGYPSGESGENASGVEGSASGSWDPKNLVLAGSTPPKPATIGNGLFYELERHTIFGSHSAGKTMLCAAAVAHEIKSGHNCAWLDIDGGNPGDLLERLRQLGCTDDEIRERLDFYAPQDPLSTQLSEQLRRRCIERDTRLAIVDSSIGSMTQQRLEPNDANAIEQWWQLVGDVLKGNEGTTVLIDHTGHAEDAQGRPMNSARKLQAVGCAFSLKSLTPFERGKTGRTKITIQKDRPNYHGPVRSTLGLFVLDSSPDDGSMTWRVEREASSASGHWRPTALMERVSEYLEHADEPRSRNARRPLVALRGAAIPSPDAYVFGETNGRPLSYTPMRLRAAKLHDWTLHEARHSCISIWASAIRNPKKVMTLAGHASIAMTLQRYAKELGIDDDQTTDEIVAYLQTHAG